MAVRTIQDEKPLRKRPVAVGLFHAVWTGVMLWVMVYLSSLVFITEDKTLLVSWGTMETWLIVGTTGSQTIEDCFLFFVTKFNCVNVFFIEVSIVIVANHQNACCILICFSILNQV